MAKGGGGLRRKERKNKEERGEEIKEGWAKGRMKRLSAFWPCSCMCLT